MDWHRQFMQGITWPWLVVAGMAIGTILAVAMIISWQHYQTRQRSAFLLLQLQLARIEWVTQLDNHQIDTSGLSFDSELKPWQDWRWLVLAADQYHLQVLHFKPEINGGQLIVSGTYEQLGALIYYLGQTTRLLGFNELHMSLEQGLKLELDLTWPKNLTPLHHSIQNLKSPWPEALCNPFEYQIVPSSTHPPIVTGKQIGRAHV